MGHQEKQSIVSIIGSVLVIGIYSLYVFLSSMVSEVAKIIYYRKGA